MKDHLFGLMGVSPSEIEAISRRLCESLVRAGYAGVEQERIADSTIFLARGEVAEGRLLSGGERIIAAWIGHVVPGGGSSWPGSAASLESLAAGLPGTLCELDGLWALVLVDLRERRTWLAADRWGMAPLYVVELGRGLAFGSSLDQLVRAAGRRFQVDVQAVAEYLHFGYCLGDKTLFSGVRRLPQGAWVSFEHDSGKVSSDRYFDPADLAVLRPSAQQDAASRLAELLMSSVERRIPQDREIVCLLSGGFDSRALAACLERSGVRFRTLTTYGDTGKLDDPDAARLVAERLGVKNAFLPLPDDYLQRWWREKCLVSDFATPMHTWLMPFAERHDAAGACNFDGIAGDVVLKGLTLRPEELALAEDGRWDALVDALVVRHRGTRVLDRTLRPDLARAFQASVRASLARELGQGPRNANALSVFVLRNRTRRAISASPVAILGRRLLNLAPFLDRELVEAGLAVEPAAKLSGELYRRVIAAVHPDLARLPSSNDAEWPAATPRRHRPRLSTAEPDALLSYVDEIERGLPLWPGLVEPGWLEATRRAAAAGPAERWTRLREAQALGELFFFLSTYREWLDVDAI